MAPERLARGKTTSPESFRELVATRVLFDDGATERLHLDEGIFVDHASRRQGVERKLMEAVETWARGIGCSELASDADIGNATSHRLHEGLGFTETERVVFYRKLLTSASGATER